MKTDWNNVATWYDEYLKGEDTYQAKVIAPNLLRLLNIQKGMPVLDVACGQGYFARLAREAGAHVTGVDQSSQLLQEAKKEATPEETYILGNAEKLGDLNLGTYDLAYSVLALENIKNIQAMMEGMKEVINPQGRIVLVMLHPAFRIPQHSDWGFSTRKNMQYRSIYKYLSELAIPIELRPFKGSTETTTTFHRSLQWYMKIFRNAGFAITNMEEWISHKKSQPGLRQRAEDSARKEFPMFLALELTKLSK